MAAGEQSDTHTEERLIDVTFDLHEIKVRRNQRLFVCPYDKLFESGLIEHDFKSNTKAIELLKAGKLEFTHHVKKEKVFLKYAATALDLFVTIGIPHNLFDLDVESCDEKEQLQYYKEKAIKLVKIIKMNNMALKKYTISKFNAKSVFVGFTPKQMTEKSQTLFQQYKGYMGEFQNSLYQRVRKQKYQLEHIAEYKRHNVFHVARHWKLVAEDIDDDNNNCNSQWTYDIYVDLGEARKPLVEVARYEDEITLNVRQLFFHRSFKILYDNRQYQQLLDALSEDMTIGVVGDYDLVQTLESDPVRVYANCDNYGVNLVYKFVLQSNGRLVLKYLYAAECVYGTNLPRKVKRIDGKPRFLPIQDPNAARENIHIMIESLRVRNQHVADTLSFVRKLEALFNRTLTISI